MRPSGATHGPSVRPPLIGRERVKSNSSFAPLGTMASPVGFEPVGGEGGRRAGEDGECKDAKHGGLRKRWSWPGVGHGLED